MPTKTTINLKYYFMSTAEVVDAFRGIPRLLVGGYCYLVWITVNWFMLLPEPTSQHTFLISTIVGGAAAVFGLYVNSGSGWDRKTARKDVYTTYDSTPQVVQRSRPSVRRQKPPKVKRQHMQTPVYDDGEKYDNFNEDGTVPVDAFTFETHPPSNEIPPKDFMRD